MARTDWCAHNQHGACRPVGHTADGKPVICSCTECDHQEAAA